MYEAFYGLSERPFDLGSDPRFLLLTPGHLEALAHLRYALDGRRAITVLLGEAGTGKTTLVRCALDELGERSRDVIYLCNPSLRRDEFLEFLADNLGMS